MIVQRIDAIECIPVECFQAYSHIDITSPSIKYYDGVGGMRRQPLNICRQRSHDISHVGAGASGVGLLQDLPPALI